MAFRMSRCDLFTGTFDCFSMLRLCLQELSNRLLSQLVGSTITRLCQLRQFAFLLDRKLNRHSHNLSRHIHGVKPLSTR